MRGRLAVRVRDDTNDRLVTRHATGLQFTKSALGGHGTAQVNLDLPRGMFPDLGPADRLYIYDARTNKCLWDGYTDNPGRTRGRRDELWEITASGGMVLAADRSEKVVYVDRSLGSWKPLAANLGSAQVEQGAGDNGAERTVLQFASGSPVGVGSQAGIRYNGMVDSGQHVGRLAFVFTGHKVDNGYKVQAWRLDAAGVRTPVYEYWYGLRSVDASLNLVGLSARQVDLAMVRAGGATNVRDDLSKLTITGLTVSATLMDQYGAALPATTPVTASTVVTDAVRRLLGANVDPAGVEVTATAYAPDQFAYPEGATLRRIVDDLALYEPDMLWEVLETTRDGLPAIIGVPAAGGGHRFRYRPWPTTPRYEISETDGYRAPGGEVELCNRVAVYWTAADGAEKSLSVTSSVPDLDRTGRIRDADPITLPAGRGSDADALRIGQLVLAAKNAPPRSGTASLSRPVVNLETGRTDYPWQVEPGCVVRIRETGDQLRLTETTYRDDDCAVDLTLGEPLMSVDQYLVQLGRDQRGAVSA